MSELAPPISTPLSPQPVSLHFDNTLGVTLVGARTLSDVKCHVVLPINQSRFWWRCEYSQNIVHRPDLPTLHVSGCMVLSAYKFIPTFTAVLVTTFS